jgi:outer membrane protein TolC
MKHLFLLSLFILPFQTFAQSKETVELKLEQVVDKVSKENFTVYENALRIYQSKESVTVARMNLLPKLNLWNLASAATEIFFGGPAGAASGAFTLVEDLAPFLVPANWFRASQTELFYEADKEGYRALWSNEVLTAKSLYFHMLLDSSLLDHVEKSKEDLEKIYGIVRVRETFGGQPQSVSQDIKLRLLSLEEDTRALESLIAEEESLLAFMMGYPTGTRLKIAPIKLPNYSQIQPLDYEDFVFRAVNVSPEIRQFNYLIEASQYVRKEVQYAFLGSSSLSRGATGGVFDGIPIQNGLGFGTGASLRIVKAQKQILITQQKAVTETVKRHLKLLVNNYNLDLANYKNTKKRLDLAHSILNGLYQRIQFGDDVDSLKLIEASRNVIEADTVLFSTMYRFLSSEDKLSRAIFNGDYSKSPIAIDRLKEGLL